MLSISGTTKTVDWTVNSGRLNLCSHASYKMLSALLPLKRALEVVHLGGSDKPTPTNGGVNNGILVSRVRLRDAVVHDTVIDLLGVAQMMQTFIMDFRSYFPPREIHFHHCYINLVHRLGYAFKATISHLTCDFEKYLEVDEAHDGNRFDNEPLLWTRFHS